MTSGDQDAYVVVTGGSRGIGAATARVAAQAGYNLALTYKSNRAAADDVIKAVESEGRRAVAQSFDMATGNVEELFRAFDSAGLGRLHGLVNNAGITGPIKRLTEIDQAMLDDVFRINITSLMLCMKEAALRMSTEQEGIGGTIVNVSSRAGQLGGAGEWIHYAASKGAVDTLTEGAAKELGSEGIRVNAVSPGLIETEIHAAAGAPDRVERMVSGVPLGRSGTAEEVAEVIVWLLSGKSSYVSGANISISGGR
ncbi:SDR family oxidoreductase [Fodinicurvata sediminis]|uniref:SDR family oxidoreductase n=1 Tax=Fodinicurvata sediminis TaxID=1121832 RepID=UPI0003B326EB|nr:SDR family oxidoreductase [Fodinicurvata sediminis]